MANEVVRVSAMHLGYCIWEYTKWIYIRGYWN